MDSTKSATEKEGPRAFSAFIAQLGDGEAHVELTTELHSLLSHLYKQAQAGGVNGTARGALTLKIMLNVESRGVVGTAYDVTSKEPKPLRGSDVFWLTPGKNLTKKNPKQGELPLRDVSAPKTEIVDESTGEVFSV